MQTPFEKYLNNCKKKLNLKIINKIIFQIIITIFVFVFLIINIYIAYYTLRVFRLLSFEAILKPSANCATNLCNALFCDTMGSNSRSN